MIVVADANIPYAAEAFGQFGEVRRLPGRQIARGGLRDADLLVVRSITKVDAALLDGTAVKFVGTCTIGEDHIDREYLRSMGIAFSSAPGCNANSVAEYVTAALLVLEDRHGLDLRGMAIGIVGAGNVGRRVAAKARALGMRVVLNDPPLAEATGDPAYRPLDEALACDVVTFHVPLEKGGAHPTWHLIDRALLERLAPGAILFNTARGGVTDTPALKAAMAGGRLRACVLDVWEGEPQPDIELLESAAIATPHIAGYSFDGKVNGTRQVYEAACRHFGHPVTWDAAPLLPPPDVPEVDIDPAGPRALLRAVTAVYDILADDAAMRRIADEPPGTRGAYFDRLRKEYPRRREFAHTRARLRAPDAAMAATLAGLGFKEA